MRINLRSTVLILITLTLLLFAWGIYSWIHGLPLTAKINVEGVPTGLHITINNASATNGVNKVKPGTYVVTASMAGFASNSTTVTVKKGDDRFVGFILNPNSQSTANWYNDHPTDQQKSQDISSKIFDAQSQQTSSQNPIISSLPFVDQQTGFRVDYGVSKKHPQDPNAIAIYITTDGSQSAKNAALGWLRFSGYDPNELEIIYQTSASSLQ